MLNSLLMITAYRSYRGYRGGLYWDNTYLLIIAGMIITLLASWYVKHTFKKYSEVYSVTGLTGAEAAQRILNAEGLTNVKIQHISGDLSDNYNPKTNVLSLSDATYASTSAAAIGVAAHECGHAIQHARGYLPIQARNAIVPFANFGPTIGWVLIIIGLFIHSSSSQFIINLGIIAFSFAVLFQLVTLPVEINASRRAVRVLADRGILTSNDELSIVRKVLTAAALTYVAGAAASIMQLMRLIILYGNRNGRR